MKLQKKKPRSKTAEHESFHIIIKYQLKIEIPLSDQNLVKVHNMYLYKYVHYEARLKSPLSDQNLVKVHNMYFYKCVH